VLLGEGVNRGLGGGIQRGDFRQVEAAGAQVREIGPIRFVQFRPEFQILLAFQQDGERQFLMQLGVGGRAGLRPPAPGARHPESVALSDRRRSRNRGPDTRRKQDPQEDWENREPARLEVWGERVLEAATLEAVFAEG
jgi:hypothetical protein